MSIRSQVRKSWDGAVDTALLLASPRRAQLRQHFRRMDNDPSYRDAALMALRVRGYRAAKQSGTKTPWKGGTRSADAEISGDLAALRNRSRELNRDDSIGCGLTKSFVNAVVGTGMVPQARTGDPAKNERIEAIWAARKDDLSQSDDLTHEEAQRLLFRKVLEDGDVLRKAVYSPDAPVWFETIEADRLATPQDKIGNAKIRDGVERDGASRPVRYWILKEHPGDTVGAIPRAAAAFAPPVDKRYISHLKITERPGQSRGVPMFHAILQDVRDLDLLLVASLKRTQIAADLAVFITSPQAGPDILETTAQKYGYKLDQSLEPGMIFKLYPEETIDTLVPNFPTPELVPFVVLLARRIGAALGVTWQIVLKDFSDSTYSSARTDLLEARRTYEIYQRWFIRRYLNWEWRTVMEDALIRGDLEGVTPADIAAVEWITPGWQWIDPLKDAQAVQIELQMNATTLRDVAAAKGRDWEELLEQRLLEEQREMQRRKELGLPEMVRKDADIKPDDEEDKPKKKVAV